MSDPLIRGLIYCRAGELGAVEVGEDVSRIEADRYEFKIWKRTEHGETLDRTIKGRCVIEVLHGLPVREGRDDDS